MPQIVLSGHTYHYTLTRKHVRRLSLRLTSRRRFSVSVPWLTPQFIILKFIHDHSDWIVANSSKFTLKQPLKNLTQLKIIDINYELVITKSARDSLVIFEKEQKIYANSTSFSQSHLQKLFDTKLRPLSLKLIRQELTNLSSQSGFKYGVVTVKNTSSRFGSCSSTNNLNFNWQIIFLPPAIFRHILLHELTHTIHHDHSHRFWLQLSQYDPDFLAHRNFLKKHANQYFLFNPV